MSTLVTDWRSDEEMACPDGWYGGYKAPTLLHVGDCERPLSDPVSGAIQPMTAKVRIDDSDGALRAQIVDAQDRYWTREPLTIQMTSRDNRAALGIAFDAFSGKIVDAQPAFPLAWDLTLVDTLTHLILTDEVRVPWRTVDEGFLHLLDYVSEQLDRKQAEPIILGRHTRTDPDVEPVTPAAFAFPPIYLGIETIAGKQRHVWMVAAHAVKSIVMQVDGVTTSEGIDWLIATQANWFSTFGAHYIDKTSGVHGNQRRYALIYGDFGASVPDKCASGEMQLLALVEGAESSAVGTGTLITDYYQQYKHFVVNYIANPNSSSYQSGSWLTSPTGFRDEQVIPTVDEDSFDTASAIAALRRPGGLEGAMAIGINGRGVPGHQILAQFNTSGFVRFGQPQRFQMGVVMLHPTQAIKDAAPLYTDAYEVLKGSFSTAIEWPKQALILDFRGDYRHETGVHVTTGSAFIFAENQNYAANTRIEREYHYLPGLSQMQHLADLEQATLVHPPRLIRLDQTIGDTDDDNWLAYQNAGAYVKVAHFDAVGGRTERLHQIVTPIIRGSARRAAAVALDVEEFIDFDAPVGT